MEARDSAFSFRASSQSCTVVRSVFSLRLERAVSSLALSTDVEVGAQHVLGTFAFYIKGRRASPPKEKAIQQIEAQTPKPPMTSPIKAERSQTHGSTRSSELAITQGRQGKDGSPKLSVLLVEDNLVNRGCFPLRFHPPHPRALTVN